MNSIVRGALRGLLWPFFRSIVSMPGRSHSGVLPALSNEQKLLASKLHTHVQVLSVEIGDRSIKRFEGLDRAADYIEQQFASFGYQPKRQEFLLGPHKLRNIEVQILGSKHPDEVIVFGAHYDTVPGTPGADDNGSGIAALLCLAEAFANDPQERTLRFVAFSNEETYEYEKMGSFVYAGSCRANGDKIVGMYSLEMLGVYSDVEGSQRYPFPFSIFYPTKGNFVAFVANPMSAEFLRSSIAAFRSKAEFPSEGCCAPDWVSDATRSDHFPFWKFGYAAVMVTDTSNFRFPLYHTPDDQIDKLDFGQMARVVSGLESTAKVLSRK